jgi:hypothetical protein
MPLALLLTIASAVAPAAAAAAPQETVNQASLSGRVTDPQGAAVHGALVIARQVETNLSAQARSDREGRFRFPYLRIGPYEVVVRSPGFADAARRVTLTVGSAFDVAVQLTLSEVTASVTVQGEAPILESSRSQIAGTVAVAEIQRLPLNGRNFLDIALLVPGVAPPNVSSAQLFAETSAVPGVGLSVSSQRNSSNNFVVDGLSANDDAAGVSGIPFGVDALEELQVITSGAQAELGRALGGYVSAVTRSGTNTRRGDLYGYFRDDAFNAANALTRTKLPMAQQQFGGGIGGPLARNRAFFFANGERRVLDQSGLATITPASVAAINARLAASGYPGPPVSTGIYANPVRSTHALAKIDHRFNGSDQMTVRYTRYDVHAQHSRGAGALNAPSASAGLDNADQSIVFANTLTISPRTVNETRAQFVHSDLAAPPADPIGPAVTIAGVATFGTLSSSPTRRLNGLYQIIDNLTHQAGPHALRTGVDVVYNSDEIAFPRAARGAYTFSSLQNFLAGLYNTAGFTQTFGAAVVAQGSASAGVYVQDEWRVSSRLTLNLGLRHDLQFLETIETDGNNLAPRTGFAWSPFASRPTVIRGSAGVFYDRVPLRAVANALLSARNTTDLGQLQQTSVSLAPSQAGAPVFPATLANVIPSVTLPNVTTMDRRMSNAYSRQASVEVEHQLGSRHIVNVGYQYLRGRHLIMQINQNVPSCAATGANNGCRPTAAYANNNQYSAAGDSNYRGLTVAVVRRPGGWGYYRVSYTLSKSMNNVGEAFFSSPIDPFDLSKDWGRSDDDQRHRFVAAGGVNAPMGPVTTAWQALTRGWQVSGVMQAYSALPLNITSGITTVQGTAGRPVVDGRFLPRNAGVGSDFASASVRLNRAFRIAGRVRADAIVETFNVINRTNVLARNANFGTGTYPTNPAPTFGQITAVGDARSFQLAVKLRF